MRLLADMHMSPHTVDFLRSSGHDALRVNEVLSARATDEEIIDWAAQESRTILTQDLDFSALIALSGKAIPSVISLRLSSSRVDYVNALLEKVLPGLEQDVLEGVIIAVEDRRIRRRDLPIA